MDARHLEFLARQPSARLQTRERFWGLPKRWLAFLLANVMFWQPLWAQAEGIAISGPGASLDAAGNGVPIVNIATPNAAGLSHSQFSDYNVDSRGVILNNATAPSQGTQLGGAIRGNPHLQGSAARDILVEVTGNNRSQLNGYTEVAGQAARVIVANPYGITCNGCGFINTPRATLTTGKALLDAEGQLQRFQVDGGDVLIEGAGINASNLDSFEVITRSARINAQIHAPRFTVIAGRNDVDAHSLEPTARADDGSAKPRLAIDSSALGGMYANAIKLVGTEHGVGVHVAGDMAASGGDIQLDASGHLRVGQMAASGAIKVRAASLDAQGPAYATRIEAHTEGDLFSQHSLAAQDSIHLSAGGQLTNRGVIEAGVNADNSRNAHGDVTLSAHRIDNAGHTVVASRDLDVRATTLLDNQGGTLSAQRQQRLDVGTLDNRSQGRVLSNAGLAITARQIDNQAGFLSSGGEHTLTVAGLLDNSLGGSIDSAAGLVIHAMTLGNAGGSVNVQQALSFTGTGLDNSAGTLVSNGGISLDLLGALVNVGGTLSTGGPLLITRSASIDNRGGLLASQGLLTLLTGDFDNRSGTLAANGLLSATLGGGLDNGSDGLIYSRDSAIALTAGRFDNRGGTLQAQTDLDLAIGGLLDNHAGRINARNGHATLRVGDFDNGNGGLYALGSLLLNGERFSNAEGGQVAAGVIDMTLTGALSNQGIIESDGTLALRAASLDNRHGQIRALSNGDLATDISYLAISGLLDNRSGTVAFANHGLGTELGGFLNDGGSLLHVGTGRLGLSTAQLLDAGGSVVSRGILTLEGAQLVNRTRLQAAQLTVVADHFSQSATGQLLATERFSGSGGNWSIDGTLASEGSFSLALTGNYTGNGTLTSQGDFSLAAAQLSLGSDAIVASGGNAHLDISGLLDNAGRLSASDLTLNADTLRNRGSLGSAGQLIVTANSLVNDQGLIFSGADMGLRVASLHNLGGALYSLGQLRIDRDGQGGLADSVVNSSGSIQSDGAMALLASRIDNLRTVLSLSDPGIYTALIENIRCIDTDCSGGKQHYAWRISQYQTLDVLAATAAASITAGGDLLLHGGALRNLSSTIATGGALTAQLVSLENTGVEPGQTVTSRTYRSQRTRGPGTWFAAMDAFNARYWKDGPRYDPAQLDGLEAGMAAFIGRLQHEYTDRASQAFTPLAGQSYAAVIQAAGPASVTTQNGIDNSVVRSGYRYIGAGQRTDTSIPGSPYATEVTLNRQLPADLAQRQVDHTALPDFSLPSGQHGLFRLSGQGATAGGPGTASALATGNAAGAHKYLIETNPLLTDLKRCVSSDHLLTQLGLDPDASAKRLGDGFYEQRLIQQAVLARTGQRYLNGVNSDEAMFTHLMNNALASRQALGLSLGTRLSDAQVAALTHDIVWLENTQVNGETVLAPVLYLAHANHRLAPNGALIQARDLTLIAGTGLNNAGTLRASDALAIRAGDSVINRGLIEADNRLDVLARNHIINRAGGLIDGRDVSLRAVTGDVLNERTVITHQSRSGYRAEQTSFVDGPAVVRARGNLAIDAGRDVNIIGGELVGAGDTTLKAGNDVNVIAAQQVDRNVREGSADHAIQQLGARVTAGGGLSVEAGNDASIIASELHASQDVHVGVGRNLLISSAADEQHGHDKTRKVESRRDQVTQVKARVSGLNLDLQAGNDITVASSQVIATHQAYFYAANDMNVVALPNTDYSLYDKKDKGSFGTLKARRDEVTRITHVGSQVTAADALLIRSGNDQHYQAARLESDGPVTLDSGGVVAFEGVKDLLDESHTKTNNNAFWNAAKGKGSTDETLRQTAIVTPAHLVIKAVNGLQIDINGLDQQTVRHSIDAMVQADPNLAWLKAAEARGDVDWRQVKEIHEAFEYSNSGLGIASQLVIAIAMAAVVGPAAMGAAAGSGTVVAAGTGAVAAGAATNASVSLINNRGDLGAVVKDVTSADAMKGYAVSALAAGAFAYADAKWFGAADKAASSAQGASSALQATHSAKDVLTWAGASDTLLRAGTRAAITTGVSTTINGGSLRDNLVAALAAEAANIAMAAGFNWVGEHVRFPDGSAQKVIAHGLVGGLLAEATGSDFKTGAAAAGLNELLVNQIAGAVQGNDNLQLMLSQMTGVLAAVAVEGDPETGATIAQKATAHNYLSHNQLARAAERLGSCAANSQCYQDTLQEFYALSMQQDIDAVANCAFAAQLCKGPSLDAQNATVGLSSIEDVVADAPPHAREALRHLIDSNIGFQEMLAVNTASHSVDAMVDALRAKWNLSDRTAAAIKENLGDALRAGAPLVGVRAAAKKSVASGLGVGDRVGSAGEASGVNNGAKATGQTLREVEVSSGGKGAWFKDLNKPEPNTVYKVDGNKIYQTDSMGRVERVESNLSYVKNDRNTYQQCVAGKCGVSGDEGGHLIASIFNGPGEKLNLLPMNGNLNKGAWKSMENTWANALKDGKPVNVKIEPIYSGSSVRPDRFNVKYSIDGGRPVNVDFKNAPGGGG